MFVPIPGERRAKRFPVHACGEDERKGANAVILRWKRLLSSNAALRARHYCSPIMEAWGPIGRGSYAVACASRGWKQGKKHIGARLRRYALLRKARL